MQTGLLTNWRRAAAASSSILLWLKVSVKGEQFINYFVVAGLVKLRTVNAKKNIMGGNAIKGNAIRGNARIEVFLSCLSHGIPPT